MFRLSGARSEYGKILINRFDSQQLNTNVRKSRSMYEKLYTTKTINDNEAKSNVRRAKEYVVYVLLCTQYTFSQICITAQE